MQGDPVVNHMTRIRQSRTCNDAKGSGNDDDDNGKNQSLWGQQQCNYDNTYQSFVYSDDNKQRAHRGVMMIRVNKDMTML